MSSITSNARSYLHGKSPHEIYTLTKMYDAIDAMDAEKEEARKKAEEASKLTGDVMRREQLISESLVSERRYAENLKVKLEASILRERELLGLLGKPFKEIASENADFEKTYKQESLKIAEWMLSNIGFRVAAQKLAQKLGLPEEGVMQLHDKAVEVVLGEQEEGKFAGDAFGIESSILANSTLLANSEELAKKYIKDGQKLRPK